MKVKEILHKNQKIYDWLHNEYYKICIRKNERLVRKGKTQAAKMLITKSFKDLVGYTPDLDNPKTFNEKINWMKLYWYNPDMIICCDKNLVREYVKGKGLEELLIPQIGVYDNANQIDFSNLPEKFVLKPSHDSGHYVLCRNKLSINIRKTKRMLNTYLKYDFAYRGMEWSYHTRKPVIVCEELLEDDNVDELYDYKFFCFNGKPKYIFFVSDRKNHAKSDFYDLDWERQNFRWYYEPSGIDHPKPSRFDDMIKYAEILSIEFPFVRVDFYEVNGKVYIGELTFFHGSGYGWFKPMEMDKVFGEMISLPKRTDIDPWDWVTSK